MTDKLTAVEEFRRTLSTAGRPDFTTEFAEGTETTADLLPTRLCDLGALCGNRAGAVFAPGPRARQRRFGDDWTLTERLALVGGHRWTRKREYHIAASSTTGEALAVKGAKTRWAWPWSAARPVPTYRTRIPRTS